MTAACKLWLKATAAEISVKTPEEAESTSKEIYELSVFYFSITPPALGAAVVLEIIPAFSGRYTQYKSPVHCRQTQR